MKTFVFFSFLCLASLTQAQNLFYGLNAGVNIYDLETSDEAAFQPQKGLDLGIHFGVFLDYSINNRIGIKTDVMINSLRDRYNLNFSSQNFDTFYVKVNTIQIAPKLKFYPKEGYNDGFFLFAGPRLSLITSVIDEDGEKLENFYNNNNLGFQPGMGFNVSNFFAIELIADIGLSDILEAEFNSQKLFAAFLNLNFNLESLINK